MTVTASTPAAAVAATSATDPTDGDGIARTGALVDQELVLGAVLVMGGAVMMRAGRPRRVARG